MIQTGDVAPTFELVGTDGTDIDSYRLDDYLDQGKTVVLAFYVFDFHPACVEAWCSFRDSEWLTFLDDVVVLGVGTDAVYSHREFARQHDISFPLLSDSDGSVAERYDALYEAFQGHRRLARRAVFVVAPDRTVRYGWVGETPADQPDLAAIQGVVDGVVDADVSRLV